jgi:hypothetical protein
VNVEKISGGVQCSVKGKRQKLYPIQQAGLPPFGFRLTIR